MSFRIAIWTVLDFKMAHFEMRFGSDSCNALSVLLVVVKNVHILFVFALYEKQVLSYYPTPRVH